MGFFTNSPIRIKRFTPWGTNPDQDAVTSDDRGFFSVSYAWFPVQSEGISGNDGPWRFSVEDLTSGEVATTQVDVSSDSQTPPPSAWSTPETYVATPIGAARLQADTEGTLCTSNGELSNVQLFGFTPGANIDVYYLRGDDEEEVAEGETADALGQATAIRYWQIGNCAYQEEFDYTVIAVEIDTGRQASAELGMYTLRTP